MAKLKVSSNIFQLNHKPILLLFGICLSSIGYIKLPISKFYLPLYFWILCLISLLFFFEIVRLNKYKLFNFNKLNYKYFIIILSGFILLFLITYGKGYEYTRIKPIVLFCLFFFFFINTLSIERGINYFLYGLILGGLLNCLIAYLQNNGLEFFVELREVLADGKYKSNDATDIKYWQRHPPGFAVTAIQFSYILSFLNIIILYFLFFKKIFKKFNMIIFFLIYLIYSGYGFLIFSKYLIISNLVFFTLFFLVRYKISIKKIIILSIFFTGVLFIELKQSDNFFSKLNETFKDRILLIEFSFLFLDKFPNGINQKNYKIEKEIVINSNFKNERNINYLINTSPHNFILTSSHHSGYYVFYFQIIFLIFILIYLGKIIFGNRHDNFSKILYFAILNNMGYATFHNSGIFNGDPITIVILSLLLTILSTKKKLFYD